MTAITASSDRATRRPPGPPPVAHRVTPRSAVADGSSVAWRNLLSMLRTPELLVFTSIQPMIFVLMFRFVFGGAITVPGESYVDYLMPGIFIQTVAFGAMNTAIGLATTCRGASSSGSVRCRWPARRCSPAARSPTSCATCGSCSSWPRRLPGRLPGPDQAARGRSRRPGSSCSSPSRCRGSSPSSGSSTANPEAAQAASFPILAIFVFASSAFVPLDTMPGWLQAFAKHQPVTAAINAVRALVLGGPTASYVVRALAWCVGIVAVFAPLAVHATAARLDRRAGAPLSAQAASSRRATRSNSAA